MKHSLKFGTLFASCLLTACASNKPIAQLDTSVYRQHMPQSILVLPPINDTPDVSAGYSFWSTVAPPVAEAGYYVFPMSIVDQMFKENGITQASEAQAVAPKKLQEIFGADAALYIRVKEYGSSYQIVQSSTTVSAEAKLVDLKTGQQLWSGEKSLVQQSGNGGGGLVGMLASALVEQVVSSMKDRAHPLASSVSWMMLSPTPKQPGFGLLYGPRSPDYQDQP